MPPGPYKPVAIKMPAPLNDPSFDAFRKELAQVAEKKDRAALAKLVAQHFFWVPEEKDLADKSKPPIENLAKALSLDGADAFGWEALAAYAADGTTMPDPQRRGVICAPAEPEFDEKAADDLANMTHTDAADWAFPIRDGIEVRSEAKQDAPVVDKLGLYLVRVLADESPANAVMAAFLKVVTSSGKVGYVPVEAVLPIGGEQLCYVKEGGAGRSRASSVASPTNSATGRGGRLQPRESLDLTPAELRALRHRLRVRPRRRLLVSRAVLPPAHAGACIGAGLPLSDLPAGGSGDRPPPCSLEPRIARRSDERARPRRMPPSARICYNRRVEVYCVIRHRCARNLRRMGDGGRPNGALELNP